MIFAPGPAGTIPVRFASVERDPLRPARRAARSVLRSPAVRRVGRRLLRPTVAARAVLARWSSARAGLALVYHRVERSPLGPAADLVPTVATADLDAQLRHLAARYRVVPAGDLHAAVRGRRRGERFPVAVTFDDDLASHRSAALPSLLQHGLTATVFVCGASLDGPTAFWWERLERGVRLGVDPASALPGRTSVEASDIHAVAGIIEAMAPPARRAVAEDLRTRLGPDPDDAGLRAEDVAALAGAGIEIGFHTREHDRLTDLDDAALAAALLDGRAAVAEAAGRPVDVLAYPHGRADDRVAAAARRAGYRAAFTTEGGPVVPASDPLLLPRVDPSWTAPADFPRWLHRQLRAVRRQG